MRKLINVVLGVSKRTRIGRFSDRFYVLDAIVRAGCLYGVEIWWWETWEAIERTEGRYLKMEMGVNTPYYIKYGSREK